MIGYLKELDHCLDVQGCITVAEICVSLESKETSFCHTNFRLGKVKGGLILVRLTTDKS